MIGITIKGILIPFLGTTIGAAMVFLLKNKISECVKKILLGFASGIMIAASIWSLLIPAINMSEAKKEPVWLAASVGFALGIVILMFVDEKLNKIEEKPKKHIKTSMSNLMMVIAVTLHNIPEGMAVGVIFAGLLSGKVGITVSSAMALTIGIAIQNIPEGAIISMPLKSENMPKWKAFLYGTISGIVEPIGALITILLTNIIVPMLAYLLAFAAGAMIYVVVVELIPQIQNGKYKKIGTLSLTLGFIIMMIMDCQ